MVSFFQKSVNHASGLVLKECELKSILIQLCWVAVFVFNSSQAWSGDTQTQRIIELERRIDALTVRLDQLELDLSSSVRSSCSYRWVDGAELGLSGDARHWLFPVVDGCAHSDFRL